MKRVTMPGASRGIRSMLVAALVVAAGAGCGTDDGPADPGTAARDAAPSTTTAAGLADLPCDARRSFEAFAPLNPDPSDYASSAEAAIAEVVESGGFAEAVVRTESSEAVEYGLISTAGSLTAIWTVELTSNGWWASDSEECLDIDPDVTVPSFGVMRIENLTDEDLRLRSWPFGDGPDMVTGETPVPAQSHADIECGFLSEYDLIDESGGVLPVFVDCPGEGSLTISESDLP